MTLHNSHGKPKIHIVISPFIKNYLLQRYEPLLTCLMFHISPEPQYKVYRINVKVMSKPKYNDNLFVLDYPFYHSLASLFFYPE